MEIDGKVAIVTGGSSGIGLETIKLLKKEGATVYFTGRNIEKVNKAEKELRCRGFVSDVRNSKEIKRVVDEVLKRQGRIDTLINNAGVYYDGQFAEETEAQTREMLETNLLGAMNFTKAVLPQMLKQEKGSIVNVGSIVSYGKNPGIATYSATKYGLRGFTYALRNELKGKNISVSLVNPVGTKTDLFRHSKKRGRGLLLQQAVVPAKAVLHAIKTGKAEINLAPVRAYELLSLLRRLAKR
ncbi:SDR family oxidoreductase [Candidatus Micrarchaeota archaeon]|nr:SDR family oxidoreductase [Candidatus Micrarchaeota archaeon]